MTKSKKQPVIDVGAFDDSAFLATRIRSRVVDAQRSSLNEDMPHASPAGAALSAAYMASTGTALVMPVPGAFVTFPAATQGPVIAHVKRMEIPVVDAGVPEVPPIKPEDPSIGGSGSGEPENGVTPADGPGVVDPNPNPNQDQNENADFTASVNTLASELATATDEADTASLVSKYASYATKGLSLVSKFMSCTSAASASAAQVTRPGPNPGPEISSSAIPTGTTSSVDLDATCRAFLTLADKVSPTHTSNAGSGSSVREAFDTDGRTLRLKILLALLPFLAGGLLIQHPV